ncbi:MAG TPA: hypothetical protein PLQ54_15330, partial [Armatimonadota bacterium]|nr:hypothetical protein [Armatimonadota bacterium]
FRFGDCALDPATYPDGLASMRRVTDRLHAAGLCAGMQPYAFFIDKRSSWVTPKPDPRLAKSETYTLAEDLTADAVTVPVLETTASVSTVTGFFVHNSVIVQIDDELIIYTGATKQAPYAFTGCQRGALGTTAAPHRRGATVGHLKECFGLLVPDPETTLFEEVAAKTAELFNEGGFDCIYLDALDGEGILGGNDNAWHYGSKYVFEIWKRLKRPAVMEMSTFHHHLWFVRSRMGAWDHPTRSHKRFIDMHVEGNRTNQRMFLPSNLGWWAFMAWQGSQTEPTYSDDIEYLCCKALGTDSGLSMTTFDPAQPAQARLAAIVRRYETLRHAGTVPEAIRARLRQPGQDYSLVDGPGGAPAFVPMRYARHRVLGDEVWATQWTVRNEFAEQPAGLRIEALSGAAPYEEPDAVALAGFDVPDEFPERAAAAGVSLDLLATRGPNGEAAGLIHASSSLGDPRGSWARLGKRFDPPLKLGDRQALGVWVRGDGKGEVLNFQLMSPEHLTSGIGEHYVIVDFEGWRYFELIEPDSDLYADLAWPYGGSYSVYRESVTFDAIDRFSLWINHLPPGEPVECAVAPVRALPLRTVSLQSPAVTIGGHTIGFPVTIETGSYLESLPGGPARVYDPQGRLVAEVAPEGALPALGAGDNAVGFSCGRGKVAPRARVTVISRGEPLR